MKIETLVDLINRERGEWQGSSVSKIVGVHAPSGYPFYYSCEQPDVINGTTWTREEFENEVAELSAAVYMPKEGFLDKAFKGASIQEMFYLSYPKQKEADQVSQPESSGGSCDYYKCEIANPTTEPSTYTAECNDLIEALDMTYAEANMFKEIWRTCAARKGKIKEGHQSTRGAEKVLFFAVRNAIQKGADVSQIISNINKG